MTNSENIQLLKEIAELVPTQGINVKGFEQRYPSELNVLSLNLLSTLRSDWPNSPKEQGIFDNAVYEVVNTSNMDNA
jgi:hypothetical protein